MLQVENISFSYRKGRKEVLEVRFFQLFAGKAGRVYGRVG